MIPNTYHWLQSVCLLLPPTKHLNSRTLWWVEGWKLLLHICLHLFLLPSLILPLSTPSPVKTSSLLCFILRVLICDPTLIFISLSGLPGFSLFFLFHPVPPLHPPPSRFRSCWQGAAIYSPVPAREWAMCVSPIVAEGAAEPDVNIRCESSHL